jgi:hypothetical protein
MSEYRDKILGFGAPRKWGKAEKKPVTNENDGSIAGHHLEHWDDHVDAVVTPKPLKMRPFKNVEGE